jgi:uncharacterized protein Yka (UPF0111/DUF47 family)
MKSFKGILVLGERHIFGELSQIIAIASEANAVMKVMFTGGYEDQVLKQNMIIIRDLEKKADEIAFRLGEDITGGAISPSIIDNLIQCVHVADDIIDMYYYLSRELCRMSKADRKGFTVHQEAEWVEIYESLFDLTDKALERLQEVLKVSSVPQMLELRKEIEVLEGEGDEIKDTGFDKLYSQAHQLHFLQFRHYSELLQKCDDILDNCEDLADLVVSVVTAILK